MKAELEAAYKAGLDAGLHGPTPINCNFRFFRLPELTREWELGNAEGKSRRKRNAA